MDTYQTSGLVVIILLLLTAFFTGIETAFFSANKLSIEVRKKQGKWIGRILNHFIQNPDQLVGTCIVGVNIMLVIYGTVVFTALQPFWENLLLRGALNNPYLKLIVEILLSSFLILAFGEFLPRILFKARADFMLKIFLIPFYGFYTLFQPLVNALIGTAEWILIYLFNARLSDRKLVFSKMELHQFMHENHYSVFHKELNTKWFENALALVHVRIRECMVPRNEIVAIPLDSTLEEARQKCIATRLSKIIVYEDSIDQICGYIHQLDFFSNPAHLKDILHSIPAVPETMRAVDLITKFSETRKTIAWVVDEFGGTAGIVTMEDVLEEIFGEFKDEHDQKGLVEQQIAEREYLFSGRLEIDYLNEKYQLGLPKKDSETLSGLIIAHHETIPREKERIIIDQFEFEIISVSETRIETVKLRVLE
ncbi:hemolysin family protein [Thermoflavifilum thermophilum]|uniref:Hemolysin, contains CBS domains n=1 Tax=Thermoflavifilum thermophilum TaxID=1393122 RepID=A0A1I7NAI6_9BACT|nr:hemolysin family protein [Thermoflavifilum thermophilum]SFV31603.1 Hemolysin, contains CBS domains [Thermoflavifilum thermophilum]